MRLYNLKILFKVSLYLERSQLKQIITMHHWQEICGPSAVGKSTFLKFLQLNSEHRTAHIVSEVDFRSLFNVGNRTDFTFIDRQIAFASAAMSSLNDAIEQSPRVIADAGIVSRSLKNFVQNALGTFEFYAHPMHRQRFFLVFRTRSKTWRPLLKRKGSFCFATLLIFYLKNF